MLHAFDETFHGGIEPLGHISGFGHFIFDGNNTFDATGQGIQAIGRRAVQRGPAKGDDPGGNAYRDIIKAFKF